MRQPIGGYLEWAQGPLQPLPHDPVLPFQSARAALLALLRAHAPPRLWLPDHTCDALVSAVQASQVPIAFYGLDDALLPVLPAQHGENEWLVYVNYLGLCEPQIDTLLASLPRQRVVIDNSQALFGRVRDCAATIYSPRKFLGVPDGGWLCSRLPVPPPNEVDTGSLMRSQPLLRRLAQGPEAGYADFQRAEASLDDPTPKQMSDLTRSLLSHQDYERTAECRQNNFRQLHTRLGARNELDLAYGRLDGKSSALASPAVPLCYPLLLREEAAPLRLRLQQLRIYLPNYWAETLRRASQDSLAYRLASRCLYLPCDQRYDAADMHELATRVLDLLSSTRPNRPVVK